MKKSVADGKAVIYESQIDSTCRECVPNPQEFQPLYSGPSKQTFGSLRAKTSCTKHDGAIPNTILALK